MNLFAVRHYHHNMGLIAFFCYVSLVDDPGCITREVFWEELLYVVAGRFGAFLKD